MLYSVKERQKQPLAKGYISGSEISFLFDIPYFDENKYTRNIGISLLEFTLFDEEAITPILNRLYVYYVTLSKKSDDYLFLAAGITEAMKDELRYNPYFTLYLLSMIDMLLEGHGDKRVLTYKSEQQMLAKQEFNIKEMYDGEIPHDAKMGYIEVFKDCLLERREVVEKTLDNILGDENNENGQNAMERIYRLEHEDKFFKKHWHSKFESSIDVDPVETNKYVYLTIFNTLDDMMRYELLNMILNNVRYRHCKHCGALFLPTGRSDSAYCSRVKPGQTQPCNKIGANLVAVEKRKNNPALHEYRSAYDRMYKLCSEQSLSRYDFDTWNEQARKKRDACTNGKLTLKKFIEWLDNTSRRRKKKE